jgi:hypothetical protein
MHMAYLEVSAWIRRGLTQKSEVPPIDIKAVMLSNEQMSKPLDGDPWKMRRLVRNEQLGKSEFQGPALL